MSEEEEEQEEEKENEVLKEENEVVKEENGLEEKGKVEVVSPEPKEKSLIERIYEENRVSYLPATLGEKRETPKGNACCNLRKRGGQPNTQLCGNH